MVRPDQTPFHPSMSLVRDIIRNTPYGESTSLKIVEGGFAERGGVLEGDAVSCLFLDGPSSFLGRKSTRKRASAPVRGTNIADTKIIETMRRTALNNNSESSMERVMLAR